MTKHTRQNIRAHANCSGEGTHTRGLVLSVCTSVRHGGGVSVSIVTSQFKEFRFETPGDFLCLFVVFFYFYKRCLPFNSY